jgi:hypothetical protein
MIAHSDTSHLTAVVSLPQLPTLSVVPLPFDPPTIQKPQITVALIIKQPRDKLIVRTACALAVQHNRRCSRVLSKHLSDARWGRSRIGRNTNRLWNVTERKVRASASIHYYGRIVFHYILKLPSSDTAF